MKIGVRPAEELERLKQIDALLHGTLFAYVEWLEEQVNEAYERGYQEGNSDGHWHGIAEDRR